MDKVRIIIVDDRIAEKPRLVSELTRSGVLRDNIDVAPSSHDARKLLQKSGYDLMILDLSLPPRLEDEPKRDEGIQLLNDINARKERYKMPKYVIGLTAFEDLQKNHKATFERYLWPLLYYDPSSDDWVTRILRQIEHIVNLEQNAPLKTGQSDICVLTALLKPELTEILKLSWNWQDSLRLDESTLFYQGSLVANDRSYTVIAASAPRIGMVASAVTAIKLINQFRPRILVMPGICAGIRGETKFGDIIFANTVWDWQSGKLRSVNNEPEFSSDPHQIHAPAIVKTRLEQLALQKRLWSGIYDDYNGNKPDHGISIHIGPVATSSAVLANASTLKQIQTQNRKLVGVEMEGYGMYAGALYSNEPRPLTFTLKSVVDFGDEQKDDRYHDYAAYTSASAMAALLSRLLPEVISQD